MPALLAKPFSASVAALPRLVSELVRAPLELERMELGKQLDKLAAAPSAPPPLAPPLAPPLPLPLPLPLHATAGSSHEPPPLPPPPPPPPQLPPPPLLVPR